MQPDLTTLRLRGTRIPGNARPNGENSFWNTFVFDVLHNVVNNIHGILRMRIGEIESFWWAEISIYQVVNNLNPFYFYLSHFIPPFTNFNRFDPISFGQYSSFFSYLMGYKLERKASFVYFDEIIRSIIDVSPWFLVIWADFKSLKASPPTFASQICLVFRESNVLTSCSSSWFRETIAPKGSARDCFPNFGHVGSWTQSKCNP